MEGLHRLVFRWAVAVGPMVLLSLVSNPLPKTVIEWVSFSSYCQMYQFYLETEVKEVVS